MTPEEQACADAARLTKAQKALQRAIKHTFKAPIADGADVIAAFAVGFLEKRGGVQ